MSVLNTDLKGPRLNIICTMDDVRGDYLRPPHATTLAAVIANKIYWFDPWEAVKHSKGDSMDYIAQFRVINPRQ